MLQFLETGKALYVLAAVCVLGILTKWLTRNLYRRLIKESENMTLTKNKNLRAFKQKAESTYRLNQGIPHIQSYLERQMYDFKYARISLNGWSSFSTQMTILCFLIGGAAAFASYWYRSESYYIVLYGTMGILAGLLTILVDNGTGLAEKKQQLYVSLENYMENTMIIRLQKERIPDDVDVSEVLETARSGTRESRRSELKKNTETDPVAVAVGTDRCTTAMRKRVGSKLSRKEEVVEELPSRKKGEHRDIDYLKSSLEQIAVSRERNKEPKPEDNWLKDLDPNEVRLIGEIIKEYLS